MIKVFNEVEIEQIFLNEINGMYDKSTGNILNGKTEYLPLRGGTRQGCLTLAISVHNCTGGSSQSKW